MSLEVIYGEPRHRATAIQLAGILDSVVSSGTVYLGYPVLASADERVYVDALLVSGERGLIAFQIADDVPHQDGDWREHIENQDRLYAMLLSHLNRHDSLRRGRTVAVPIETVTIFAEEVDPPTWVEHGRYTDLTHVEATIESSLPLEPNLLIPLQAALERVTNLKPIKRRADVTEATSRGAILRKIEKGISNLDRWQKQAAIETPEGPQRIRGLAGSGKTIVLALKAAYLHAQHPNWSIVVSFQSRALHQQFERLVTQFTYEHSNDAPDYEKLQILHAWGASGREGVYKKIAKHVNAPFRDYSFAMSTFGRGNEFRGVCEELLQLTEAGKSEPLFDAVLVDEAQDLPSAFFKLVHRFTREPKRIIWAFDELQNLTESAMPSTDELFGEDDRGQPIVTLPQVEGDARRDIILPICYRNTPWSLAAAHSLGFGIYRDGGLVQHFDDTDLWTQIGYAVAGGELQRGQQVVLERSRASSPEYFDRLLNSSDAVMFRSFSSPAEQDNWVADEIQKNLDEDEIDHDDILIVLPDAVRAKRRASQIRSALARRGIDSHLAGVDTSADEVFIEGSVALANIYRAKGNEAPMVYALDSQYAAGSDNAVSRRNTIFTAITRSRAWVRVCGWGEESRVIAEEFARVTEKQFRLDFRIPTAPELEQIRRIHRERSADEVATLKRATEALTEVIEAFDRDEFNFDELPPAIRTKLADLIDQAASNGNDTTHDSD